MHRQFVVGIKSPHYPYRHPVPKATILPDPVHISDYPPLTEMGPGLYALVQLIRKATSMRASIPAVIPALLLCHMVHAMDIRGVSIGDTYNAAEVERKLTGSNPASFQPLTCSDDSCSGYINIGPGVVDALVSIEDGKVDNIQLRIAPRLFQSVLEGLKAKWGKPTSETDMPMQTGLGIRTKSHTALWKKNGQLLQAVEFYKTDTSLVILIKDKPQLKSSL